MCWTRSEKPPGKTRPRHQRTFPRFVGVRRRGSELPAERGGGRPFSAAHGGGFYHLLVSLEMDLGKGLLGRCLSALLRGDPLLSSCASFCSVCVWVCFFFVCFVCFSWDPTDSLSRRLHCRALVRVIAFYRKTDLRPHRIVFLVPFQRLPIAPPPKPIVQLYGDWDRAPVIVAFYQSFMPTRRRTTETAMASDAPYPTRTSWSREVHLVQGAMMRACLGALACETN